MVKYLQEVEIKMKTRTNKNPWVVYGFGIFYLIAFFILEQSTAEKNLIYSPLDDLIPFCEYFIIPYVLWFVYVIGTVVYFLYFHDDQEEYRKLVSVLGAGMSIFIIISFVYPNYHELRPELGDGNIFVQAVKLLYLVDTPTNLLPSIHVYNSLACFAALSGNKKCREKKGLIPMLGILTLLISLSTVFLKQHSIIDVIMAVLYFVLFYGVFYLFIPMKPEMTKRMLRKDQVLTIPNGLSMVRLFLALVFWGIGTRRNFAGKQIALIVTMVLSGITDFLDGWIARKFNMVSEFGKVLDPIADKVTQGVLLLYLVTRYEWLQFTLILFVVKEFSMLMGSIKAVSATGKNDGAKWYGKVSTAVFYVVMILLIVFPQISYTVANTMIMITNFFLTLSFILYMKFYISEYNTARRKVRWPA